eukprot:gene33178-42907_t
MVPGQNHRPVRYRPSESGADTVRVHFQGWNSKYDEWIERSSYRLAPRGSARRMQKEMDEQTSKMVGWFQATEQQSHDRSGQQQLGLLYESAAERLGLSTQELYDILSTLRSQSVRIDDVEDFCIEYTYANPSLWLISASGIWYRLAGAFCVTGGHFGRPFPAYSRFFQPTLEKFETAAHVAMCLLDLLPVTPAISFTALCELAPPEDWVTLKVGGIGKSPFIRQLKKETASFMDIGGFQNLAQLVRSDSAMTATKLFGKRRVTQMKAYVATYGEIVMDNNGPSNGNGNGNIPAEVDDVSNRRKKKYPIEDTLLLSPDSAGRPDPIHSPQLMVDESLYDESYDWEEAILVAFACVNNFRQDLQLPFVPLRTLEEALADDGLHPILREVHVCMLSAVLEELMTSSPSSVSVAGEPNPLTSSVEDLLSTLKVTLTLTDQAADSCYIPTQRILEPAPTTTSDEPGQPDLTYRAALRVGEGWLEVLRLLICHRHRLPLSEYMDQATQCRQIVEWLANLPEAVNFCRPVDVDSLPGYEAVISSPLDLGTILNRIDNGWYNRPLLSISETSPSVRDMLSARGVTLTQGGLIDFYHSKLNSWVEAIIVHLSHPTPSSDPESNAMEVDGEKGPPSRDSGGAIVLRLRFLGWGADFEERVEI